MASPRYIVVTYGAYLSQFDELPIIPPKISNDPDLTIDIFHFRN